jgi:hypothetical protein
MLRKAIRVATDGRIKERIVTILSYESSSRYDICHRLPIEAYRTRKVEQMQWATEGTQGQGELGGTPVKRRAFPSHRSRQEFLPTR